MDKFVSFVLVALRLAVLVVDHIVGNVSASTQQDQHFSCCREMGGKIYEMGGKNIRNVNLSVTINFHMDLRPKQYKSCLISSMIST